MVEKTNVFFATICLVVLTVSLGVLSHRLRLANASGKRWCVIALLRVQLGASPSAPVVMIGATSTQPLQVHNRYTAS